MKPLKVLLLVIAVGLIGFGGWYAYHAHAKTPPPSAGATYSHGKPVPADSQARAKAAGYYCPSWDAAPGQMSADFCVSLDK